MASPSREHIPIVDIYPAIYDFLSTQGYSKSARAFAEEALLAVPPARRSFGTNHRKQART
jgi:hypothetical protein